MENMKNYTIGRDERLSDIVLADPTISKMHAELVVTGEGHCYLTDCGSTNGTFRASGGDWEKIRQSYVEFDEPLRIGSYETTVRILLEALPHSAQGKAVDSESGGGGAGTPRPFFPKGKLRRNPQTGELEPY